ncbi:acyl-CoA dehydrogenase family protein [Sphingomonas immobilis]|uniref:Acyl-CoA dehydrogenase family protein n=1 Tax=Sphingomonas immobilis TaxID=3063997 RepID=A0ABT8ZWY2_9SPHN|nr:acyl-CoA dehydrogenase family protein [Sphingomonas sp. CA1-15]MDO7842080.1 acyl-CoA dehydrogenase family protein [Sphingomonas sp. CA1-15]
MDFNDTPEEATFRAEARSWLAANAPDFIIKAGETLSDAEEVARGRAWQARLAEGGYAGILLPKSLGGRGGTIMEATVFGEEEGEYHLPKGPYIGIGLGMALPVIHKHGTPEQIEKFAAGTLKGEITWCQLFSEPAAGSDLAGIRTKAVKDGDEWVVNGQKVWSSWAHHADWGILIVRTDPTVPKHKGLSFFVVDMKTPGIDVRPIRQISGLSDFNETFFTDARIPDANRIGAVGEGWACAMTVLMGERLNQGGEGKHGGIGALIAYAADTPRDGGTALDSSAVRVSLAAAYAEERAERYFQARLRTMVSRGENPGALASVVKLAYTNRYQKTSGLAMELRGLAGLAPPEGDTETQRIQYDYIWSTALRVAGGADEVLRNQISERILGMPGEIRTDKNVPFDQL